MIHKELKEDSGNSRWTSEILATLQVGSLCLVSLVKIQNDPIITEGGVEFYRNPELVKFHKF